MYLIIRVKHKEQLCEEVASYTKENEISEAENALHRSGLVEVYTQYEGEYIQHPLRKDILFFSPLVHCHTKIVIILMC